MEIILEYGFRQFAHTENACETNESLMRHGYIGASPERVSLAFPICTFEIFRQVHRVCPRYSLDALSKTLMNLHHVRQVLTYLFLINLEHFRLRIDPRLPSS